MDLLINMFRLGGWWRCWRGGTGMFRVVHWKIWNIIRKYWMICLLVLIQIWINIGLVKCLRLIILLFDIYNEYIILYFVVKLMVII